MKNLDAIFEDSLNSFLSSERTNREGQTYKLFDSQDRERDLIYLKEVLHELYVGESALVGEENKKEFVMQMLETFLKCRGIRIDEKGERINPLKFLFEDMKQKHNGQLDPRGGVTLAQMQVDGIIMLIPALKTEIENNLVNPNNQSIEGTHTIIHEFVHAMAVWVGYDRNNPNQMEYVAGIRPNDKLQGIWDDLNEGLTEYITRKILLSIFKGTHLEGKIEERYPVRVKFVEEILNIFEEKQQKEIIKLYLTGNSREILQIFANIKHAKGKSLTEFLNKNYQDMHRGISGCQEKGSPLMRQDEMVFEEIKEFLNKCTYLPEKEEQNNIC